MKSKRVYFLLLTTILSLFLAACNTRQDLWVYNDESWKFVTETNQNYSAVPNISGAIFEGLNLNLDLGAIGQQFVEFAFEQQKMLDQNRGLDADFEIKEKGDRVTYRYEVAGETLKQLQQLFSLEDLAQGNLSGLTGSGMIDPVEQEEMYAQLQEYSPVIHIEPMLIDGDQGYLLTIDYPDGWMLLGSTFTLHGRDIDDFNTASDVTHNTAVWNNPVNITASFKPQSRTSAFLKTGAIILAGLILAGLLALLIIRLLSSPRGPGRLTGRRGVPSRGTSYSAYQAGRKRGYQPQQGRRPPYRR